MPVFDDETIGKLSALRLSVARQLAGETGAGQRSRSAGGRFEFRDHRAYASGDDLREIDWNLYGRLGHLFVKRFQGETDLELHVVLDRSASMAVGSPSKDVFARRLAAAFAYALAGDGRRVRVQGLSDRLVPVGPTVRGEPDGAPLLRALEELPTPAGRAELGEVRRLYRAAKDPRLVVVLSDFLQERPLAPVLAAPRSRRVEVLLTCLVAREERAPRAGGAVRLVGIEGEGSLLVTLTPELVDRYGRLFELHLEELHRTAAAHAMVAVDVAVERPFERALLDVVREGRVLR